MTSRSHGGCAAAAVLVAVIISGCGASSSVPASSSSSRSPASTAVSNSGSGPAQSAPASVIRSIHPGGFLDGIAYSHGLVWVSDLTGNRVIRFDTASGRALPDTAVPDGPLTVTATASAVWVASYHASRVTRFVSASAASAGVITTPSPQPTGMAIDGPRLWIFDQSDGAGGVVDTAGATLNRVTQPAHAGFASAGFGAIWVPDFTGATKTISRVDSASHAVRTMNVGNQPIMALAAADSVWVSNTADATITRLDPNAGTARATISVPGGQTGGLAYSGGVVWVASHGGDLVAAINPATNKVIGTVTVPGPAENIAADPT